MAKVNFPEKEKANVTRPCLVAACRGNENIAGLLNYLIYEAQDLAEKTKVEASDIPLQLSHDKMLNRPKNEGKRFNFSERSLIGYLRSLDEWKLVSIEKYGRSQVVHIEAINKAIATPPAKPQGKPRGRRKSGNVEANKTVTKASTLSQENVELKLKVEKLQEKVEMLQLKVEMFQDFVETFQLSKSREQASQAGLEAKNRALYSVDTVYSIDFFTGACYRADEEPTNPTPEKKEVSSIAYSQDTQPTTTDSSRLQENKAHQSTQPPLFQESVPAQKSAAPRLPNMTKDVLQRENRPPTPAEQKRIDDKERRERAQQVRKRTEELWLLFDRLFKSRVNRYGYNKPQVEELALNDLATDEIIEKAFEAVAKSDAVKKDPTRLSITNIAIAVPSFIRVEQIKVVESSKPKEETALERIKRERREILAREKQKEMAQ